MQLSFRPRTLWLLIVIIALISCNASCIHNDQTCDITLGNAAKETKSYNKPVIIVLCDFSISMDSICRNYVFDQAQKILDKYCDGATIRFYPISELSTKPLFESEMIPIDSSNLTEGEANILSKCLEQRKVEYNKALLTAFADKSVERPSATHIIRSLERAITEVQKVDPKRNNHDVIIILSDMLESGHSTFGPIDIEHERYAEGIRIVESTGRTVIPPIGNNIEIKVGFFIRQKQYDYSELSHFWQLVFAKFGYTGNVVLSNELGL